MNEIIFTYMNARCHARIVNELPSGCKFIGRFEGDYLIYRLPNVLFNPFNFIAIKEN